jgi:hypothetical protein
MGLAAHDSRRFPAIDSQTALLPFSDGQHWLYFDS